MFFIFLDIFKWIKKGAYILSLYIYVYICIYIEYISFTSVLDYKK